MTDDHDRYEWMNVASRTSSPGLSGTKSSVCVCVRAPALVSQHVQILVLGNIDLCRKRELDLTLDHFPLKSIYCEGLSVYRR